VILFCQLEKSIDFEKLFNHRFECTKSINKNKFGLSKICQHFFFFTHYESSAYGVVHQTAKCNPNHPDFLALPVPQIIPPT
jgi:hypothetical protein